MKSVEQLVREAKEKERKNEKLEIHEAAFLQAVNLLESLRKIKDKSNQNKP